MIEEIKHIHTGTDVLWALLGGTGGAVKVFFAWTKKLPENWKHAAIFLLLNVFISGFSGYMGAIFASTFTGDDKMHVIFAGIFGYLGVTGLDWISEKIKK